MTLHRAAAFATCLAAILFAGCGENSGGGASNPQVNGTPTTQTPTGSGGESSDTNNPTNAQDDRDGSRELPGTATTPVEPETESSGGSTTTIRNPTDEGTTMTPNPAGGGSDITGTVPPAEPGTSTGSGGDGGGSGGESTASGINEGSGQLHAWPTDYFTELTSRWELEGINRQGGSISHVSEAKPADLSEYLDDNGRIINGILIEHEGGTYALPNQGSPDDYFVYLELTGNPNNDGISVSATYSGVEASLTSLDDLAHFYGGQRSEYRFGEINGGADTVVVAFNSQEHGALVAVADASMVINAYEATARLVLDRIDNNNVDQSDPDQYVTHDQLGFDSVIVEDITVMGHMLSGGSAEMRLRNEPADMLRIFGENPVTTLNGVIGYGYTYDADQMTHFAGGALAIEGSGGVLSSAFFLAR